MIKTKTLSKMLLAQTCLSLVACGPLYPAKKISSKEWSSSLAQGRRVGVEGASGEFETLISSRSPRGNLPGLALSESKTRQVIRSPQSGIGLWVLMDPVESNPVPEGSLYQELIQEISEQSDLYGVAPKELGLEPHIVRLSPRLVGVAITRSFQDTLIRDSYMQGIFWRDDEGLFRLREVVNQTHGPVTLNNDLATGATWDDLSAVLPTDVLGNENAGSLVKVKTRGVILAHAQGGQPGILEFSRATEFTYKWSNAETTYTVTLQDGTGKVLEAYSSEYRAALPIQANVYKRTYLDAAQVSKNLTETPFVIQANTIPSDIDGIVDLGNATNVQVRLQNKRGVILPRQGNAVILVPATPVVVEGSLKITTTGDNLIAMNTYTSILEVNQFMRRHLMDTESSFLNAPTAVRINVRGSCNAFYDSQASAISLFAAGNGCANVALVNDVVYHEWGHGLDNFTGVNVGITDGAFSEAIGDIIAAYLTGSPVTAPGFLLNDATGIRNLDNQKKYPGNLQNEVHADGEIIGGAFWRLRQGLVSRFGPKSGAAKAEFLFARHLLSTDSYLQSYQSVLRLDDVDGNPMTKSPNHCLINTAFAFHGLATDENCQDDATPFPIPVDNTAAIAVYRTTEQGVLLMASSEKGKKLALCLDTKEICIAQPKSHMDLVPEGSLDQKTIFVTKDPIPALKALSYATLIVKGPDDKPIGIRSFKLSLK